jgi:hypothetical protein
MRPYDCRRRRSMVKVVSIARRPIRLSCQCDIAKHFVLPGSRRHVTWLLPLHIRYQPSINCSTSHGDRHYTMLTRLLYAICVLLSCVTALEQEERTKLIELHKKWGNDVRKIAPQAFKNQALMSRYSTASLAYLPMLISPMCAALFSQKLSMILLSLGCPSTQL